MAKKSSGDGPGTGGQPGPDVDQAESERPGLLPTKILAKIQAINANCVAKLKGGPERQQALCVAVQQCYDVLIEHRKEGDRVVSESVLVVETPQRVLELAVELGWLPASILD